MTHAALDPQWGERRAINEVNNLLPNTHEAKTYVTYQPCNTPVPFSYCQKISFIHIR